MLTYLAVTSTSWLNSLKPDVRDQFVKIFKEETVNANARAAQINADNKKKIVEAGGVVRTLTPEQRQTWVDTMKPVWKKFEADIGTDVIEAAVAGK